MPTIFSNHYNSSGTVEPGIGALTEELGLDEGKKISAGYSHSRIRRSHARVGLGTVAGIGDEVRMLTLKSSDRLYSLLFSCDGVSTAGAGDIGIYLAGNNHDGALPHADCHDAFATALAMATGANRAEKFVTGPFDEENMGLQMWELVNIVASETYTVDPGVSFDITITMTTAQTAAMGIVQLEAFYTAGD